MEWRSLRDNSVLLVVKELGYVSTTESRTFEDVTFCHTTASQALGVDSDGTPVHHPPSLCAFHPIANLLRCSPFSTPLIRV